MRRSLPLFLAGLALAAGAFAQQPGGGGGTSASEGRRAGDLRSTRHNMSRQNPAGDEDVREVCVYCHTPTIVDAPDRQAAGQMAPTWQPSLATGVDNFEFGIYDDIGRGQGVGSQSMACLSCHDFTQAFGVGDYDHPIGIPYRGALTYAARKAAAETPAEGSVRRAARTQVTDADFKPARQGVINNREVWWVPTSDSSVARTRQDIPLYVRPQLSELDDKVPFLECSSCHDPHSSNRQFLRVANQQGRLCHACHEK